MSDKASQRLKSGDYVRVVDTLPSSMSHFESGCEAVVIGSYADQFGGNSVNQYTIFIKGRGKTSWYHDEHLTLIEKSRMDLLQEWELESKRKQEIQSDLTWIFANGMEVIDSGYANSIAALGRCLGVDNLWGSKGEGFVYFQNSVMVMLIAHDFLIEGDKEGFLEMCADETGVRHE